MADYKKIWGLSKEIEHYLGGVFGEGKTPENGTEVNAENLIRHALAIVQEVSKGMKDNPHYVDCAYIQEKISTLQRDLDYFTDYREREY